LPGLAEPPPLENPAAERLRLWMAVRLLLAAAASHRPVLIILDDLQWTDEASIGLLSFLIRRNRELQIMLLGIVRDDDLPEDHPIQRLILEGFREGTLVTLPLAGLGVHEVGALAAHQHQVGRALTSTQVEALHAQCAGNPRLLLELLALLEESSTTGNVDSILTGILAGTRSVPSTIRLTLGQRVDRQSNECRLVLRICAVVTDDAPISLLAQVAELDPDTFHGAIAAATSSGLLVKETSGDTEKYALHYALLGPMLYVDLLPTERQRLHHRVATVLAAQESAAAGPTAHVIARHYLQGADPASAVRWLERAGDHAAGMFAPASAFAQYRKALDLLEHGRAPRDKAPSAASDALPRILEKLGNLQLLDGDYGAAQAYFARARELVTDNMLRADLLRKEGVTWEKRGDFSQALAAFDAAEQVGDAPRASDVGLASHPAALLDEFQAKLALSRGEAYWSQGDFERAATAAAQALTLRNSIPEGQAQARALYLLGRVAEVRGDYKRAETCYKSSLAIRERIDDQQGIAACWYGLGLVAYDQGDVKLAVNCHERSMHIREHIGDQWGIAFSWGKLAQLAQYQGDYARADECNRQSFALQERIGSQPGIAGAAYQLGQVAREYGGYAEAARNLEHSLRIQERIGDCWGCSNSLSDLGDVARDRGDFTLAEQYYERSLAIKEQLGDQLGIAQCLHNQGLLACERGDFQSSLALERRARRLARRLGTPSMEARAALGQAIAALLAGQQRRATLLTQHSRGLTTLYGSARTKVQLALVACTQSRVIGHMPEAIAAAQLALRLAVHGRFRREEALAQRLLGQCTLATGDATAAIRLLRGACALFEEIGARVEHSRTQLVLAEVLSCQSAQPEHAFLQGEADELKATALACLAAHGASTILL
ncbi:MAG: tetratricopeptide repeat protein, partial [Chloroflexi bacterium]|nr:tetratricopeptide repeat protein [Chloroflexota bacterium]